MLGGVELQVHRHGGPALGPELPIALKRKAPKLRAVVVDSQERP